MTRLFNRNNNKTTIAELEEYYANQNQRKNRTGTAWLMALLSLFITIAVIIGLFFAGRWIYRTITNDDAESPTTTTDASGSSAQVPNYDGDIGGQGGAENETVDEGANTPNTTETSQAQGTVSEEAATTTEPNADRISATGAESEIPNTGAGEVLLIAPMVAGLAGYTISLKKQSRRN
jgi:hypothetical protein